MLVESWLCRQRGFAFELDGNASMGVLVAHETDLLLAAHRLTPWNA
jgi:hypothetical protein